MAKTESAGSGDKRLDLAGGGGSKMRWLLAAGLVVIIVGSVILAIKGFFDETPGSDRTTRKGPPTFQCRKCGHKFNPRPERKPRAFGGMPKKAQGRGIDCPKCKVKHAAHRMIECPKCEEHFLPPWAGEPPRPGAPRPPAICPECDTNVMEYVRKKAEERRKQRSK